MLKAALVVVSCLALYLAICKFGSRLNVSRKRGKDGE
jgi:hypothetical protein